MKLETRIHKMQVKKGYVQSSLLINKNITNNFRKVEIVHNLK